MRYISEASNIPVEENAAWHTCSGKVGELPVAKHALGRWGSRCEVQTGAHFGPQSEYLADYHREGHRQSQIVLTTESSPRNSEVHFDQFREPEISGPAD